MKSLLTKHPHKTLRYRRRFAFLPVDIRDIDGRKWRVWLEHYEVTEIYYAHGESMTGYDYTPRGWHHMESRPAGFHALHGSKLGLDSENS